MLEIAFAKLIAPILHVLSIKKLFILALPTVLCVIALRTVNVDQEMRHAFYTYMHLHSPPTSITIFASGAWSIWRWRKKLPLAPFLFVWLGFLASMIPGTPAPWTYIAVVVIFWTAFIIFLAKPPVIWFLRLRKPRAF